MKNKETSKIRLYGFNNLTKTLSFNMYDICYTKSVQDRDAYIAYIDEQYNADRLTSILKKVTEIIGANILNIAKQDYDPQGASVTLLVCEESTVLEQSADHKQSTVAEPSAVPECSTVAERSAIPERSTVTEQVGPVSTVAHLDKSHITVHTYPEYHPDGGVCTFRADIDVSTCGQISPLKALDYLISCFEADIMTMDYRVRGFTRDITGKKLFMNQNVNSIQDFIDDHYYNRYQMIDVNVYQENIFHTKCKLKEFDIDNYTFGFTKNDISPDEVKEITNHLSKEMDEIFYGRNMDEMY